jgi:heptosyltransferase-1
VVLPKCSIQQLASIIGRAQAAVGVDTGLSHLAAALNIPTVAIYTDTNPALTGVMQGAIARAVNLGGIAQTPSHTEVLSTLQSITSKRIS